MDKAASAKVAVLGARVIGTYIGGRLAAAGASVTLIGRRRVTDELRASGLRLTDLDGADLVVPANALSWRKAPTRWRTISHSGAGPRSIISTARWWR
jgi:2-dehydropantoate 2-reductase